MGHIPPEWQALLGGPAFTGNGVMSINSQCSNGPSFYAFNPDDVGVTSPIPSIPLMYFPLSNPLADPDIANDLFSRADQNNAGIVFPSGTRSVLFFHRHGYGSPTYKVDDGCGGDGGEGAKPYRRQITAFDANDLLAVRNGTRQPYDIQPYAWWVVPGPSDNCGRFTYSGLAYDPGSRRIFSALSYSESPEIHVWQVADYPASIDKKPAGMLKYAYSSCAIYTIQGKLIATARRFGRTNGGPGDLMPIEERLANGLYLYQLSGKGVPLTVKKMLLR